MQPQLDQALVGLGMGDPQPVEREDSRGLRLVLMLRNVPRLGNNILDSEGPF